MGVPRQIIGSFEDIGKDVLKQTASVPKDVVGKALESLGTSAGKQQGKQGQQARQEEEDKKIDKAFARQALESLASPKPKKPTVQERLEKEEAEKQKQIKEQKEITRKTQLLEPTLHEKRGNLPGMTRQKAGSETSRNVRQD